MAINKEIPTGVKVISVLYYIIAVVILIIGLIVIFAGGLLGNLLKSVAGLGNILTGAVIFIGILLLAIAVLDFFIGRGLWKGQNWARIIAIIFGILGILATLFQVISGSNLISGLLGIIINGVISGYLLFSQNVNSAF